MSKPVRLPDYLYAEIEHLATQEKRSLANMVKVLLEQALKMEGSLSERGGSIEVDLAEVGDEIDVVASRSESDRDVKPDFK